MSGLSTVIGDPQLMTTFEIDDGSIVNKIVQFFTNFFRFTVDLSDKILDSCHDILDNLNGIFPSE
jgi:hypothetical protein